MKIMSFNLLCYGPDEVTWYLRLPLVLRTIRNANPDSFGVQEAHIMWMNALKYALPDYDYVGVGRDDGKEDGEFSAIFYKKDKFTVLDKGNFWLSETPEKPGKGWDAACIRICSWAKLKCNKCGKEFVHLNTHLDHKGPIAMQKGAELVAKRGIEIAGSSPAFFTGDFNVTPESLPCKAVKECGFVDCRDIAKTADKGATFHAFKEDDPSYHTVIDYVFVKGDVKVNSFKVIRDHIDSQVPSDHYPVIAEVEI